MTSFIVSFLSIDLQLIGRMSLVLLVPLVVESVEVIADEKARYIGL